MSYGPGLRSRARAHRQVRESARRSLSYWRRPSRLTTTRAEPAGITLLSPAVGTTNAGDYFIEAAVRRLVGHETEFQVFSTRRELRRAEIERINESRAVLICGTNLYQAQWTAPAISARSLRRIKVPVIPLGVGTSSSELGTLAVSPKIADLIRRLHDACEIASVRDPETARFLEELGIGNARLTGCPVLHWHGRSAMPVPQTMVRQKLIISPRNWLMHHPDPVNHPSTLAMLTALVESFPDADITYAIHEEIDARIPARFGLREHQIVWPRTTDEYVNVYSDPAAVVVGFRLHGGMLALANGVPAVFVGHDTRTYSFCEMVGLECVRQLDPGAPDRMVGAVKQMLAGDLSGAIIDPDRYGSLRSEMADVLMRNGLEMRGGD